LVFDTSLLAAFDHPGVDPAAQQQAANLLSQQSYQPQSITPPSLPGAGLSEPRPQTVTQGAPYYDPIAIHQGTAPVDYQYSGPSVDMSGYLGLGTYMGIPRQPNQSTDYLNTVNEEFSTIDRGLASAYQGVQQGGPMPADNILQQLGYTNPLYSSQYQGPTPQYGTTNRPGTLGGLLDVNRAGQSQYGGLPGAALGAAVDVYNTEIPIYSDFARSTLKPAAEFLGDRVPQLQGFNMLSGAVGGPSTGDIASAFVPVTLGDVGLEALPGIGSLPDAWRLASRLAPDATDFANVIKRGGQALDNRLGQIDLRSEVGAIRVPGGAPDPNKMTPENISSISRRLKGGDEKPIFEGVEIAALTDKQLRSEADRLGIRIIEGNYGGRPLTKQERGLIQRRLAEEQASTVTQPASPYIPGTEAYARGRSAPDMPDYSNDPGYWESMAKQADTGGNPARSKPAPVKRTVTMGDGTAVDASPENIQEAVDRYLRRPATQKAIKVDPARIADDPEGFLDTIANQVVNAKTRGGRPLMAGVTPDEVKQVLMNQGAVKVNPAGPVEIVAKQSETLETALAKVDSGGPTPPEPPGPPKLTPRDGTPNNRAWNAFLQAWNLPRSLLASLDFSYPLRQGGMLIRHGNEWTNSFGAGLKAFRDDAFATQTMDGLLARQADGSLGTVHVSTLDGGLTDREEDFASALLNKIPGFRRSAQANIVFINKLRADTYDSVIRMWDRTKQPYTDADKAALGNYINRATGRGTLDLGVADFEKSASALATGIFSPRHLASRVQAPGYLIHPNRLVRNEAWKDVTAFAGAVSGLLALADLSGLATVELDPRSANFGKMRVGNTRVDFWTGYQQIGRLIALVADGKLKTSSGNFMDISAGEALLNFARGKVHPTLGAAADQFIFGGKNIIGEQIDWGPGEAANRLVPLAFQSMYDAINEGDPLEIALSGLNFLGAGTQTYEDFGDRMQKVKDKVAQELFPGRNYDELYPVEKDQVDADERVSGLTKGFEPSAVSISSETAAAEREAAMNGGGWTKEAGVLPASEIDRRLASGEMTGAEARAAYGKLRENLALLAAGRRATPEVQEELAKIEAKRAKDASSLTPQEQATTAYYDILDQSKNPDGTFNFDLYNQKLDEWVSTYGDQRDLISASREPLSAGEAELKALRTELDTVGWFESYDSGYERMKRLSPEFGQLAQPYATYDDFEAGVKQRITDSLRRQTGTQYIDQDQVNELYFNVIGNLGLMKAINVIEASILAQNPALIPQLQKWYDLDEGELKILKEMQAVR
jgi:hypothetical protein